METFKLQVAGVICISTDKQTTIHQHRAAVFLSQTDNYTSLKHQHYVHQGHLYLMLAFKHGNPWSNTENCRGQEDCMGQRRQKTEDSSALTNICHRLPTGMPPPHRQEATLCRPSLVPEDRTHKGDAKLCKVFSISGEKRRKKSNHLGRTLRLGE